MDEKIKQMQKCLNCAALVSSQFCPDCGQKTSTRRFVFKSFMTTDFVQGILQFNGRLPYTIKTLVTRPGHGVREYIQGKRIVFFNGFSLLFLLWAINYLIVPIDRRVDARMGSQANMEAVRTISEYAKWMILSIVPFFALVTYLVFKKAKQSYFEHIILHVYFLGGGMIFSVPLSLLMVVLKNHISFAPLIVNTGQIVTLLYYSWALYQYFSVFAYSKQFLLLRIILTYLLLVIAFVVFVGSMVFINQ